MQLKKMVYAGVCGAAWLILPSLASASGSLQSEIDRAKVGAVIQVAPGTYEEQLEIARPVKLIGTGKTVIRSCEPGSVMTLKGRGAVLENIQVESCGEEKDDAAITVSGTGHQLKDLKVETRRFGIKLDHARGAVVKDSRINGERKGNAVHLWKSSGNRIEGLEIERVADGIYTEDSHRNTIRKNKVRYSRYGLHLMFSNDNIVEENRSEENTTGLMLMQSKRTLIRNNQFLANRDNVNAQGLLIYIAPGTLVTGNEIVSNRVGIYLENAKESIIRKNKLLDNFIGIQFKKSAGNEVTHNTFVGNVNDAQAVSSKSNQVQENYWDAASKVDTDGDGKSNIPYEADPYFQTLTSDVPEYQLFFQSPGLILLKNMLKSPPGQLLADETPLMQTTRPVEKIQSSGIVLWGISLTMMLASAAIYLTGRKRT